MRNKSNSVLVIALICISSPVTFAWTEYRITTSPAEQTNPDIDGSIVAWEDTRHGNIDIYAADITDINNPIIFPVSTHDWEEISPQVSGRKIFYTRKEYYTQDAYTCKIYMYDIDTGITSLIADAPIAGIVTGADDSTIVWARWSYPNKEELSGYDIQTDSVFSIPYTQCSYADVDGNKIVWATRPGDYISVFDMDLWESFRVSPDDFPGGVYCRTPAISGNNVVWHAQELSPSEENIRGADISDLYNPIDFTICTEPLTQSLPAISGNNVVWQDLRNSSISLWDIYGYNLTTETEFQVCSNTAQQCNPAISGNIVVWDDTRHGHSDIYATILYGPLVPQCLSPIKSDMNGDCRVDFQDFAIFCQSWLECNLYPPSACWEKIYLLGSE